MITTILYPNYAAGADRDELRLSLRSIAENLRGDYRPVIVGDIPDWYTGDAIPLPRITQNVYQQQTGKNFHPKWHGIVDVLWKYRTAAKCPNVSDTFVVWYDETYLFHPIDVDYFLTPRYIGQLPEKERRKNEYWDALIRSRKRLLERDLPIRDFSTHHPFPLTKGDLFAYFQEFNPLIAPSLIESQYTNWRRTPSKKNKPIDFQYMNRRKCDSFSGDFPDSRIINIGIVTPKMERALRDRFNEPSPWEKAQ